MALVLLLILCFFFFELKFGPKSDGTYHYKKPLSFIVNKIDGSSFDEGDESVSIFTFGSQSEADAFIKGVEFVNDSALILEKVNPITVKIVDTDVA